MSKCYFVVIDDCVKWVDHINSRVRVFILRHISFFNHTAANCYLIIEADVTHSGDACVSFTLTT